MTEEHHISATKTARYFTMGSVSEKTSEAWIVCHGYGQLASWFIQKFKVLAEKGYFIIAPEGFHRYYLEGNYGRVGASWMTKEDRLNDIKDYTAFLDTIYDEWKSRLPNHCRITVLGFSQGCATVSRWVSLGSASPARLILYAGVFPPDMDFDLSASRLKNLPVVIAAGDKDEFLTADALKKQMDLLREKGIDYIYLPFEGGHEIRNEVLQKITGLSS
ncbi:MAG: alpha/beta hydrolase [Bacteroidota bacterium]